MDLHVEVFVAVDIDDAATVVSLTEISIPGQAAILVPRALFIIDDKVNRPRVEELVELLRRRLGLRTWDLGHDGLFLSDRHLCYFRNRYLYRG